MTKAAALVIAANMAVPSTAVAAPGQNLRAARRAFTRGHICAAARQLFGEIGDGATTMEQIGKLAGAPRSTLYTHFRDKDEILEAIAEDYIGKLEAIVVRVPYPRPSRADLRRWIGELAAFISDERMPTILFNAFGVGLDVPLPVRRIGESVMQALAARLPAFQMALVAGPRQLAAKAYAQVVVRELSLCCQTYAIMGGDELGLTYLELATDLTHRFVTDFGGGEV